ncbi:MAG: hypothetical protein LBS81_01225 [Endomicrobium sp.]|nr:hypothetical protein [Endomicrobium sp.]
MSGNKVLDYIEVQVENNTDMQKVSNAIRKRLLFTHRMPSSATDAVKVLDMAEYQKQWLLYGMFIFISFGVNCFNKFTCRRG